MTPVGYRALYRPKAPRTRLSPSEMETSRSAMRVYLDRVYASHEPSAVERLAALESPNGPAAQNIPLWDERQVRTNETLAALDHAIDVLRGR